VSECTSRYDADIDYEHEHEHEHEREHDWRPVRRPSGRAAVTLMEVVFAIGVILTGLVGIAALIPIAANNAKATMELDRSISESTSAAAIGEALALNDLNSLVIFDKPAAESEMYVIGDYAYAPSNALRTIRWKTDLQTNYDPPIGPPLPPLPPVIVLGKLESPGYGHHPLGSGLTSGICIDPLGMPDPNLASPFAAVNQNDSAFDYSRFPYYGERYNVLNEPNLQINNQTPPAATTPLWPMSPRMWRATLRSPLHTFSSTVLRHQLIQAATARNLFRGSGGISGLTSNQPEDPQSVLMSRTRLGGQVVDSAMDTSSQYTWFATLVPPFLGGNSFRQSIVVVRQRLAPVPQRAGDPLALQRANYTVESSRDNPSAERLTWVGDAIGFQGGAGGEVQLYGSQAVSDEVRSGEWVMLSRQPHVLTPTFQPRGPAVHRWFRVLRVGESEQVNNHAWPGGTHNVWRRWVTLAGPDWAFQDELSNTTPTDDTFCTIVTGAVSVIESEVLVQ
jgi:hypothetical protein